MQDLIHLFDIEAIRDHVTWRKRENHANGDGCRNHKVLSQIPSSVSGWAGHEAPAPAIWRTARIWGYVFNTHHKALFSCPWSPPEWWRSRPGPPWFSRAVYIVRCHLKHPHRVRPSPALKLAASSLDQYSKQDAVPQWCRISLHRVLSLYCSIFIHKYLP